jgi:DNA-binding NarL/FixJ family response regulator
MKPRTAIVCTGDPDLHQSLLEFNGWHEFGIETVLTAGSGPETILLLDKHEADILIIDDSACDRGGADPSGQIRAGLPDALFILISDAGDYANVRRSFLNGATDFCLSP